MRKTKEPRILYLDIETAYMTLMGWRLFDQSFNPDQIIEDISILSIALAWNDEEVQVRSTAGQRNLRNDRKLLKWVQRAIAKADILVTQNGKCFDLPIIRGRISVEKLGGLKEPSRHIDTRQEAKRLGFPSTKQEYLTRKYCPQFLKSKHNDFPGISLWTEFLAGNPKAQKVMQDYNAQDVRGLRGVFHGMKPVIRGLNIGIFNDTDPTPVCPSCGSTHLHRHGWKYTEVGKYRQYQCMNCGAWPRGRQNFLSAEKRASLKKGA